MAREQDNRADVYAFIGSTIAKRRNAVKLSQQDLASQVGLTRTSISNIESGRQKMLVHTLLDIAKALGVGPDALLAGTRSDAATLDVFRFSGADVLPSERATISALVDALPKPVSTPQRKAR